MTNPVTEIAIDSARQVCGQRDRKVKSGGDIELV
jgi:hypothetical protein